MQSTYIATTLGMRMNFVADPLEHGPRMPATIGPRVRNSFFADGRDALDGLGLAVSVHNVGPLTSSCETIKDVIDSLEAVAGGGRLVTDGGLQEVARLPICQRVLSSTSGTMAFVAVGDSYRRWVHQEGLARVFELAV